MICSGQNPATENEWRDNFGNRISEGDDILYAVLRGNGENSIQSGIVEKVSEDCVEISFNCWLKGQPKEMVFKREFWKQRYPDKQITSILTNK